MIDVDGILESEIIGKPSVESLADCKDAVKDIQSIVHDISEKSKELMFILSIYNIRFKHAYSELGSAKKRIEGMALEIENRTRLFNELKGLIVGAEIKDEYLNALESVDFNSKEKLSDVKMALEEFSKINNDYTLRILDEQRSVINGVIKTFCRSFSDFFNGMITSIVDSSNRRLALHSYVYESVERYEFILKFIREKEAPFFQGIASVYSEGMRVLYRREFERSLSVVRNNLENNDSELEESIGEFMRFFFFATQGELKFYERMFASTNTESSVMEIFKDSIALLLHMFYQIYELRKLRMLRILRKGFDFGGPDNTNAILSLTSNKIREEFDALYKEFVRKEEQNIQSKNRAACANRAIAYIKESNDSDLVDDVVKMTIEEILKRNKGTLEEIIYTIKLMHSIKCASSRFPEEPILQNIYKDFDKSCVLYVFKDDTGVKKRAEKVATLVGNDTIMKSALRKVLLNNADGDKRKEIGSVLNAE